MNKRRQHSEQTKRRVFALVIRGKGGGPETSALVSVVTIHNKALYIYKE